MQDQFPPTGAAELQQLVRFIETTDLQGDGWQALKQLYKKLEVNPIPSALVAIIVKLDKAKESELKQAFPTKKTLGYMKRRAARFLRNLSIKQPELYVLIAKDLMVQQKGTIDFENQWVLHQILVGNSNRYHQKRHGRGKIFLKKGQPNIYRAEENNAAVWNEFPMVAEEILNTPHLQREVYEFAIKVLLRNKKSLPQFSLVQGNQFFESHAPWLQWAAVQRFYGEVTNGTLQKDHILYPLMYFFASADRRATILKALLQSTPEPESAPKPIPPTSYFDKIRNFFSTPPPTPKKVKEPDYLHSFINQLTDILFRQLGWTKTISTRIKQVLAFILEHKGYLSTETIYRNGGAMIATQQAELEQLVLRAIRKDRNSNIEKWLGISPWASADFKPQLYGALYEKIQSKSFREQQSFAQNYMSVQTFEKADFGWYLIAKDPNIAARVTHQYLRRNLWQGWKNHVLQNMVRSEYAAKLLIQYCQPQLPYTLFKPKLFLNILQEAHPILQKEALKQLKQNIRNQFFNWLPILAKLPEQRDAILQEMEPQLRKQNHNIQLLTQCLKSSNNWVSKTSWRVLENHVTNPSQLQQLLVTIIYRSNEPQILAFIERISNIKNNEFRANFTLALVNLFKTQPYVINRIAPLFGRVTQLVDIETIVEIIRAIEPHRWKQVKDTIRQYLESTEGVTLWMKVLEAVAEEEGDSTLANRLLEDEALSATFFEIQSPEVLDCHHPAFENLLLEWLKKHDAIFNPNSPELFQACTHRLPKIRNWGLQKSRIEDMELSFAMQLLESELREAVAQGKRFFEHAKAGSTSELEHLLALCDSPNTEVRAYGVTFFKSRKAHFENAIALECLVEHTDPIIQEFVAQQLNENKPKKAATRYFDRAVLRTKNKGRKAKELVKDRVETNLEVDAATLLELARGTCQKDKEWALEQLMKLALKGEETFEFHLS